MPTLETRAPELQRSYDRLQSLYERRLPFRSDEFEALAEVSFRLAVHPETDAAEAFRLLYEAYKLDASNPKYAYHLGRLYLVHGELDRGAEWLLVAVRLCPTSHRIWSHLSIVQRALDERVETYTDGDADSQPDAGLDSAPSSKSRTERKYKRGALRQRAEQIATAVRNGDDSIPFGLADVVPPRSLARFEPKAAERIESIRKEQGSRRADEIQSEAERLARAEAERLPAQERVQGVRMKHVSAAEAAGSKREPEVTERPGRSSRRAEHEGHGEVAIRRIVDPGRCRWSGIHDIQVDIGYVSPPNPGKRDELLPELEHVLGLAAVRTGGGGAFAVLAVEWLVSGYPPRTIRKLSERLSAADRAVVELLELVCELFEIKEGELSQRLADCVERSELPPTLVALIHQRRLLWRPLTFPNVGAYRRAKAFVAGSSPDGNAEDRRRQAAGHVAALESAIRLLQPRAPSTIDELALASTSAAVTTDEAVALLDSLEGTRAALERVRDDAFGYLGDVLIVSARSIDNQHAFARVAADHRALRQLAERLHETARAALDELNRLRSARVASDVEAAAALDTRASACGLALEALSTSDDLEALLDRVEHALAALSEKLEADEREPSGAVQELVMAIEGIELAALIPPDDGAPTVLDTLDRDAHELGAQLDEVFERLAAIEARVKAGEASPEDQEASAQIAAFVDDTEKTVKQALTTLDAVRKSGEVDDPRRLEALEAVYKRFNTRPAGLRNRLRRLDWSPTSADVDEALAEGDEHVKRVNAAIGRAERALDENFENAWRGLDAYGPAWTKSGPLAALRTVVAGRRAETLYRMGRHEDAKRVWHAMLASDRLNVPVLKNLAIAHLASGETSQATEAWRSYLEALYFLDVVAGSPRPRASERARVHQECANAYGTHSLLGGAPSESEDLSDIPDFLARRGRVAAMASHRRLEGLNRWLGYRSPTLVLGVSRSTDEESLSRARERQLLFVRDACGLLPDRTREAFRDVSVAHVESAYRESLDVKRRTLKRERYYKDEEGTHLSWIKETIFFKVRVRNAIYRHTDWAVTAASGDVIGSLAHVDAIRLDPADDLVCRTAESIGIPNPEEYLEQCNDLVGFACKVARERICDDAVAADGDAFNSRFDDIVESWTRNAIPEQYVELLDDPQPVYAASVGPAFQVLNASGGTLDSSGRRVVVDAIDALQVYRLRLPRATGPARLLAQFLASIGRVDEARTVLVEARESAFSRRGRTECAELLAPLAIDRGEFEMGLGIVRELIDEHPGRRNLLVLVHNAYIGWLNASQRVPAPASIAADFDRWVAGITADESSEELREEAVALKRRLVVLATVAAYGDDLDTSGLAALIDALQAMYAEDPGNFEARFHEMRALEHRLVAVNEQLSAATGERRRDLDDESRSLLAQLEAAAEGVATATSDPEHQAAAESILRAIRGRERD